MTDLLLPPDTISVRIPATPPRPAPRLVEPYDGPPLPYQWRPTVKSVERKLRHIELELLHAEAAVEAVD